MNELEIVFWYWWVLAVGFLAIELLAPGFFFLWLAVSAFVVGSVLLMIPSTSFEVQLFLFSVLAVASILVWRRFVSAKAQESVHPLLNQRGAQYIGRTFNLIAPIENGQGKIRVDDTLWKVHGEDCPVGSKVKVIAVRGTVFDVEKCE
jgi:membrane protein implicated in regulation of membrane protease activity